MSREKKKKVYKVEKRKVFRLILLLYCLSSSSWTFNQIHPTSKRKLFFSEWEVECQSLLEEGIKLELCAKIDGHTHIVNKVNKFNKKKKLHEIYVFVIKLPTKSLFRPNFKNILNVKTFIIICCVPIIFIFFQTQYLLTFQGLL